MTKDVIERDRVAKQLDLTQSQLLIWTGQQLNPQSPIYNMAFTFEIFGEINTSVFEDAFTQLVHHSDTMRTVIELENGIPKQRILSDLSFVLQFFDFSGMQDKESHLQNWLSGESKDLFDLSKRLFDSALIKMDNSRFVWFLKQHHLITDGMSKTILFNGMSDLYKKILNDEKLTQILFPLYQDYINYESNLRKKEIDSPSNYWTDTINELSNHPPLFRKSNQERNTDSERLSLTLSKEKTKLLKALTLDPELRAWTQDLALFNIFSTLFLAFLFQKTNGKNISVGIPVPNRPSPSFKRTPGLFTELYPMLVKIDKNESFISLFEKVKNASFECLKNSGSGRSNQELSSSFNVVINYMNGSFGAFNGLPTKVDWVFADHVDPAHFLRLQIFNYEQAEEIEVAFDMNNSIFDEKQRMSARNDFEELLDLFLQDRTQAIQSVSTSELAFIQSLSKKEVSFPQEKTIVDCFEEQVSKSADRIAVIFKEERISYRELDEKVNQLAHYLRKNQVKEGTYVGLCLERSTAMIIAMLAIIKAGGTYVPIDPDYPQDRIDYILDDAALKIIVCQDNCSAQFQNKLVLILNLDTLSQEIEKESRAQPVVQLKPEHSLYIIYTSGSTGNPKGVIIEHKNLVRLFFNEGNLFDFSEKDVWTLFHSFCFDFSVWEMYGALLFGGTLLIVDKATARDPQKFSNLLQEKQVTVLNQTPSAFYSLQEFYNPTLIGNSIRYVIFGGEALNVSRLGKWKAVYPESKLINMFGITETTVHVTYKEITEKDIESGVSNVGFAIPTLECLILDEDKNYVPLGVSGEIYVGGAGVARGYLNRPALTAERFVKNPYGTSASDQLYKSGDLGMRLSDGSIQYLGRIDDQVKIRGHRIELGEIEYTLNQHKNVAQSICLVKEEIDNSKRLIAFVIAKSGYMQKNIDTYLQEKLPEYMIPSGVVAMDAFPLTGNGKVDKKAILKQNFNVDGPSEDYVEASSDFEQIISEIWSEVLGISALGVDQNFFRLGGDSLSGIRVLVRINEAFDLDLPVNTIFKKNTIRQLAKFAEDTITSLMLELDNSNVENT